MTTHKAGRMSLFGPAVSWRRRLCRKHGQGMCLACRSTCTYCGFSTWRAWEDHHA